MRMLQWPLFVIGWLAVVGSGFFAPHTFLGLLALSLDGVAFGCLLASLGVAHRSVVSGGRKTAGWIAAVLGAGAFPLAADIGVGGSFHGLGPQPPDICRFPSLSDALGHVLSDPVLVAVAAAAPLALAAGWWAVGRTTREAVVCYVLCLAAYATIVFLLHAV